MRDLLSWGRNFFLWQLATTAVGILAYLVWYASGFGPNHAITMAGICIVLYSLLKIDFNGKDVIFGFEYDEKRTGVFKAVATVVVTLIVIVVGVACDFSIIEKILYFSLAVILSLMLPVEMLIVMLVLFLLFFIGFGVHLYAISAILCFSTIFGFVLTKQGKQYRAGWIFLSSCVQAIIISTVFYLQPNFLVLKVFK